MFCLKSLIYCKHILRQLYACRLGFNTCFKSLSLSLLICPGMSRRGFCQFVSVVQVTERGSCGALTISLPKGGEASWKEQNPAIKTHTHTHTMKCDIMQFPNFDSLYRALGGASSLRVPRWGGTNGSCLFDYLPKVHNLLSQKVGICCHCTYRPTYTCILFSHRAPSWVPG